MKLSSCFGCSGRRGARLRNAGSLLTRGTTIGLPLSTTLPVMPSPSLNADGAGAILEALDGFDLQFAVAQQRDHAAHDAVMTDAASPARAAAPTFRLSVPDSAWLTSSSVESRRASRAAVVASGPGLAAGIAGLLHICAVMRRSHAKLSSLGAWSNASTRQHVVGPAAGGHEHPSVYDFFVVTEKSQHESVAFSRFLAVPSILPDSTQNASNSAESGHDRRAGACACHVRSA